MTSDSALKARLKTHRFTSLNNDMTWPVLTVKLWPYGKTEMCMLLLLLSSFLITDFLTCTNDANHQNWCTSPRC